MPHDLNLPFAEASMGSEQAGASPFTDLPTPNDRARHPADQRNNNGRKLWDVPREFHCPIVGTCLHVDELRQIARKSGDTLDPRSSDYQLHVRFVSVVDEKNSLSVLEQLLDANLMPDTGCEYCSADHRIPCPDLAGRRALCIGGRSSLTCHYRSLVERYNGELINHDGGLEDSRQRLDSLLCAADVVVFPADCVSHDAHLKAKRYCKRTAKPYVLRKSSGAASFARALEQVAA